MGAPFTDSTTARLDRETWTRGLCRQICLVFTAWLNGPLGKSQDLKVKSRCHGSGPLDPRESLACLREPASGILCEVGKDDLSTCPADGSQRFHHHALTVNPAIT